MSSVDTPVLAIVIETAKLRWFIAGLATSGEILPLLRSQVGDFDNYLGADFDDQMTFLRHRFSGVIQRGGERMIREGLRPGRIVFLADAPFQRASRELTDRVAEHFVQWMNQPPVTFLMGDLGLATDSGAVSRPAALARLAGQSDGKLEAWLGELAPRLAAMMRDPQRWETAPRKRELADPRV
jgi:hypothetical protein